MPVIDAAIDQMPQTGGIVNGHLAWPRNATLHVEGPAGEPFMRIDVQPSGLTNVVETVDLVMAFESDRVLLGSSLGLGLLVLPYPPGVDIPFNKSELEPWWGARSHMVLAALSLLIALGLLLSWAMLGWLYMVPVKIFSINRVTWRGAWQLASAAHMPGALVMCAGMLFYGLKQLELIGLVLFGQSTWCCPGFYLFLADLCSQAARTGDQGQAGTESESQAGQAGQSIRRLQRGRGTIKNRQSVRLISAWPSGTKTTQKSETQLRLVKRK